MFINHLIIQIKISTMTAIEFQSQLIKLKDSLMRFAFNLTSDKDDAKDLVQETFLRALKYSNQYEEESNIKAWTSTIMKNTFINNYRQGIRQNQYRDQTKDSVLINHTKTISPDEPDSIYTIKEIYQNIERLEDKFRIPFEMHINGYKYKEIADELNLNIGTVKSRIFSSRKKLKDIFKR
jgi:RNA polymerase sigma-70 factor, ECF subfamily